MIFFYLNCFGNNKIENNLREDQRRTELVWCWKEQEKQGMAVRQKAVSALPTLLRTLRKEPLKPHSHVNALPSLRRAFSLYDQINLIDQVPEDQLRFQGLVPIHLPLLFFVHVKL